MTKMSIIDEEAEWEPEEVEEWYATCSACGEFNHVEEYWGDIFRSRIKRHFYFCKLRSSCEEWVLKKAEEVYLQSKVNYVKSRLAGVI